ncbi:hypothetical protein CK203_039556 [Vitis vinifera]|uniref:Reverse transcriptase domain-containing protein n=1 Tax=Vitis vinifera TaxID=29760 RepID=A0A438HKG8_VITVI|nr:hypothetical protein CK203_039556 [Vitis vinifera]
MFSVSCLFNNCMDGMRWVFTGVYGPVCRRIERFSGGAWVNKRVMERPLGGPLLSEGGLNNQSQSRLDRWRFEEGFVLDAKLRALKGLLKTWNKEVFGVIETKKREALSQVVYWDAVENHSTLSLEDCEARKEAKEVYKTWVLREEISWRQRSRELWLKVDDCWHKEELDLKNSVVGAFNNLYIEERGWHPGVEGLPFMRLDSCEVEGLEISFSEGEVFAALSDLGKDKAPTRMASPWLSGVEDLKDFRPISLVGSFYKLLAKVLANRIKKVIGKVISESQNAFVEGRQILDAVLIANEAVDSRLKDNVGGALCKLDIEKTYDRVSWSFLLVVLKEMGTRRLRQGDPLSPYLFVITMEVFSSMMRRAISGGYLSGWKVSGGRGEGMHISHLLFADDTLVFCEESSDEMTYLSWLLMWFEACSGLRINLEKSEMIPVGRVLNIEGLALELGCKVGGIPSSYLGMPLGAAFNSLAMWDGVEERFRRRLVMWKRQYISKGGRLTLIRSTMSTHKPYLVRWNLVCLEKRKGGLGVRNLSLMNNALLCKWNWRFANEREALWRSVISLKYGVEEGGWCTRDVMGRNGVGLWKAIRKKWGLLDGRNAWVSEVWNPIGDGKIQAFRVQREEEDRVIWTASNDGAFSVRSLYYMMKPGGLSMFPSERMWRARVPPKVAFFAWEASWGKVLTQEQLQRRGFSLANSEDNPSWVEWRVCGKKTQEGLANGAFMYFLVSLEGEK